MIESRCQSPQPVGFQNILEVWWRVNTHAHTHDGELKRITLSEVSKGGGFPDLGSQRSKADIERLLLDACVLPSFGVTVQMNNIEASAWLIYCLNSRLRRE